MPYLMPHGTSDLYISYYTSHFDIHFCICISTVRVCQSIHQSVSLISCLIDPPVTSLLHFFTNKEIKENDLPQYPPVNLYSVSQISSRYNQCPLRALPIQRMTTKSIFFRLLDSLRIPFSKFVRACVRPCNRDKQDRRYTMYYT